MVRMGQIRNDATTTGGVCNMNFLDAFSRYREIGDVIKHTSDPVELTSLIDEAIHCCTEMSVQVAMVYPQEVADMRDNQLRGVQ